MAARKKASTNLGPQKLFVLNLTKKLEEAKAEKYRKYTVDEVNEIIDSLMDDIPSQLRNAIEYNMKTITITPYDINYILKQKYKLDYFMHYKFNKWLVKPLLIRLRQWGIQYRYIRENLEIKLNVKVLVDMCKVTKLLVMMKSKSH